jgi:hypothetical protein
MDLSLPPSTKPIIHSKSSKQLLKHTQAMHSTLVKEEAAMNIALIFFTNQA